MKLLSMFVLMFIISSVHGIELLPSWKTLANIAVQKFEQFIGCASYCIINPEQILPIHSRSCAAYFCPRLLLWDPLHRANMLSATPLLCPDHFEIIEPLDQWMNGSANSRNPRAVWDCNGMLLLISREYECPGTLCHPSHRMRTTDYRLLKLVGEDICDIIFTYKHGFFKTFLSHLADVIISGISFHKLSESLKQLMADNFALSHSKWKHDDKSGYLLNSSMNSEELKNIEERLLAAVPDEGTLRRVFNQWSELNNDRYSSDMREKTASALMADHTFKVSRF